MKAELRVWGSDGRALACPVQRPEFHPHGCMYRVWEHMPVIPAFRRRRREDQKFQLQTPVILAFQRQKQVDICEFKAYLVYKATFGTSRITQNKFICGYITSPRLA